MIKNHVLFISSAGQEKTVLRKSYKQLLIHLMMKEDEEDEENFYTLNSCAGKLKFCRSNLYNLKVKATQGTETYGIKMTTIKPGMPLNRFQD